MHELGIAQDFWAVIRQQAEANGLKAITKISIVLGEASGIEIEFLRHSLKDHILPGTIGKDAVLEFIPMPLAAKCNACGTQIDKHTLQALCCPQCGSNDITVVTGKEAYVQSIEGE